jgi:hypothetical protein
MKAIYEEMNLGMNLKSPHDFWREHQVWGPNKKGGRK